MAATRSYSSNGLRAYSVPALLKTPYNLSIETNGFKTVHLNGVVIEVNQRARLHFGLTTGSKTDIMTVLGTASLLNTSDASVSTLIGNRFVENIPFEWAELQLPHRSCTGGGANADQFVRTETV